MGSTVITPWHQSFGLRLRQARKQARYSTRQVARLIKNRFQLQLSHGSLARIERGEQRVSIGMLAVLSEIYETAPFEIAVGVDPGEDAPWPLLVRAGLERQAVAGVVWLEQMLDHGSSDVGPDARPAPAGD
ncbi:MAG: multiprotein-bridging factor 1 family protein [Gemmatimonadota bacterium]